VLERYKIKHDIPLGDIVELEFSVSNIRAVAYRLEPNLPAELLESSLRTAQLLLNKRLLDPQITILKWLFSDIISPKGLMHLKKETIVNCLGIAQAVLFNRGHKLLALAITSYIDTSDITILTGVDSRARIPKDLLAELDIYFPYVRKSSNKTKNKVTNLAHQSIDKLVDDLSMVNWMITADKQLILDTSNGKQHSNRLIIPHDIKILVTKFVLDRVKRKDPKWVN
jgi:hypothetical protein